MGELQNDKRDLERKREKRRRFFNFDVDNSIYIIIYYFSLEFHVCSFIIQLISFIKILILQQDNKLPVKTCVMRPK